MVALGWPFEAMRFKRLRSPFISDLSGLRRCFGMLAFVAWRLAGVVGVGYAGPLISPVRGFCPKVVFFGFAVIVAVFKASAHS